MSNKPKKDFIGEAIGLLRTINRRIITDEVPQVGFDDRDAVRELFCTGAMVRAIDRLTKAVAANTKAIDDANTTVRHVEYVDDAPAILDGSEDEDGRYRRADGSRIGSERAESDK